MTTSEPPVLPNGSRRVGHDKALANAIGEAVEKAIARELVRTGAFDPLEGSLEDLRREAKAEIRRMLENREPFHLVRDHEPSVLEEARRYAREGSYEFSITLYATFIEHRLNGLIAQRWYDDGRDENELLKTLRGASLARKTSDTWEMMFGNPLPEPLRQQILSLAELRNDFVHYKWRPIPRDYPLGAIEAEEGSLRRAERIVDELDRLSKSLEPEVTPDLAGWLWR